ncbi:MAG: hypothetical protein FJW32_22195 [Acidobacteria bacterium]|nr:hypothetical protein [Acidobacteriota bacterium]
MRFAALICAGVLCAADSRVADAVRARTPIDTLVKQRADVNGAQIDGTTALHWAAQHEDVAAVKALLAAGADAKVKNRYGLTPLSLAATNGNGPIVELLIKAGADPNLAVPGGETPLMTAARTGKLDAVKALLRGGANVNAKEEQRGQTAIMWAAAEGHAAVVETLVEFGANFRERLRSGFTPYLFAVREGRIAAAKSLIKAGVDVNEVIQPPPNSIRRPGAPRAGTSALVLAVINGHFELAARLLEAGADPNSDGSGMTALHAITQVRKPGLGDNDPSPTGSGNITSADMVRKLKEHGADLNARMSKKINIGLTRLNTEGATPFLMAARTGDAEMMRLLASLGADPLLPTVDGSTPLMVAAGLGTRSPGEDAGSDDDAVEACAVALELGNKIDAVDSNGETAMHGAAYKNGPKVVEFLNSKNADPVVWNKKNKFGWTPLRIAEGYRFGNYKPSLVTVDAFHRVMKAHGIAMPGPDASAVGRP